MFLLRKLDCQIMCTEEEKRDRKLTSERSVLGLFKMSVQCANGDSGKAAGASLRLKREVWTGSVM